MYWLKKQVFGTVTFGLLAFFVYPACVSAFQVDLENPYFSISGANSTQTFYLTNDEDVVVPIEMSLFKRSYTLDGEEVLTSANEDFFLAPSQVLLMPHNDIGITLSWAEKTIPTMEVAYRLYIKELLLPASELEKEKDNSKTPTAKIKFLKAYYKSIFVLPPIDAKPKISLESAQFYTKEPEGASPQKTMLALIIANKGTAHWVARDLSLSVTPIDKPSESSIIKPKELAFVSILADSKIRYLCQWPENTPTGSVTIIFPSTRH